MVNCTNVKFGHNIASQVFLLYAKFQKVWFSYKRYLRFLKLHILICITFDTARLAERQNGASETAVGGVPTSHSLSRQ